MVSLEKSISWPQEAIYSLLEGLNNIGAVLLASHIHGCRALFTSGLSRLLCDHLRCKPDLRLASSPGKIVQPRGKTVTSVTIALDITDMFYNTWHKSLFSKLPSYGLYASHPAVHPFFRAGRYNIMGTLRNLW